LGISSEGVQTLQFIPRIFYFFSGNKTESGSVYGKNRTERHSLDKLSMNSTADIFQQLTRPWRVRLLAVAMRQATNRAQAEDWLQETLLRGWRDFSGLQNEQLVYPWLLKILSRVRADELRKEAHRSQLAPILQVDDQLLNAHECSSPGPFEQLLAQRNEQQLQQAISQLPDDFQWVVILRDIEGLSYHDIGYALDIPKGTVMSRLSRGRCLLAASLLDTGKTNSMRKQP
jgi:RNA polymerase sigma-70 factor, ECF subfamily